MAEVLEPGEGAPESPRMSPDEAVAGVAAMALAAFNGNMRANRDMLARVRTLRGNRDRPPNLRRLGEDIATTERRTIERVAIDVSASIKQATEQFLASVAKDVVVDKSKTAYPIAPEQFAVFVMAMRGKDQTQSELFPLIEACGSDSTRLHYAVSYLQWIFEDTPDERLGRALLPVVVAEFEELLAALVRLWLTRHPQALGVDQKQVTVAEVVAMRSTDDFMRRQVDERVRDVVDGGPDEWDKVFSRALSIPLPSLTDSWVQLVEALARRNLVVHAGGRVDRRYLQQSKLHGELPALGSPLRCPPQYVLEAIEAFERLGQILTVELLFKLTPRSQFAVEVAANEVLLALVAERWAGARRMSSLALDNSVSRDEAHEIQVNNWMARRELNDQWPDLRVRIEEWNPPEGAARYVLAKAALLEDEVTALRALARCEQEGPSPRFIAGWPLMIQFGRRNPRVQRAVSTAVSRSAKRTPPQQSKGRGRRH